MNFYTILQGNSPNSKTLVLMKICIYIKHKKKYRMDEIYEIIFLFLRK